nr:hypothetical protein Iba_chr14aCG15140 [Ipomoea batatas]
MADYNHSFRLDWLHSSFVLRRKLSRHLHLQQQLHPHSQHQYISAANQEIKAEEKLFRTSDLQQQSMMMGLQRILGLEPNPDQWETSLIFTERKVHIQTHFFEDERCKIQKEYSNCRGAYPGQQTLNSDTNLRSQQKHFPSNREQRRPGPQCPEPYNDAKAFQAEEEEAKGARFLEKILSINLLYDFLAATDQVSYWPLLGLSLDNVVDWRFIVGTSSFLGLSGDDMGRRAARDRIAEGLKKVADIGMSHVYLREKNLYLLAYVFDTTQLVAKKKREKSFDFR